MIPDGMVGIGTLLVLDAGLRAPAAPGSIVAVLAQRPGGSVVGVVLSVVLSAATAFVLAAFLLRVTRRDDEEGDLVAATASMEALKGKKSSVSVALTGNRAAAGDDSPAADAPVHSIVFACDAGMGSSAMGASVLRNKIKKAGFDDVSVVNLAIANLEDDVDLVVAHRDLTARARGRTPSARHVPVDNFMNSLEYDAIVEQLRHANASSSSGADAPR